MAKNSRMLERVTGLKKGLSSSMRTRNGQRRSAGGRAKKGVAELRTRKGRVRVYAVSERNRAIRSEVQGSIFWGYNSLAIDGPMGKRRGAPRALITKLEREAQGCCFRRGVKAATRKRRFFYISLCCPGLERLYRKKTSRLLDLRKKVLGGKLSALCERLQVEVPGLGRTEQF